MAKLLKHIGGIKLSKNDKSIDFIFEVVRRNENWEKKFIDKIKLYKDFYYFFVPFDCGYITMPQLIFVCEDDKHMAETFKLITVNKIKIKKINLLFTTDLKQNNENLENSLTEFKLDPKTNKYKAHNVDLKILS